MRCGGAVTRIGGTERNRADRKTERRMRTAAERITSDERQRVLGGGKEQGYVLRRDDLNKIHPVGSLVWSGSARVEPSELNLVSHGDMLERKKPTSAMSSEDDIARPAGAAPPRRRAGPKAKVRGFAASKTISSKLSRGI